jgi:hypothetical protein
LNTQRRLVTRLITLLLLAALAPACGKAAATKTPTTPAPILLFFEGWGTDTLGGIGSPWSAVAAPPGATGNVDTITVPSNPFLFLLSTNGNGTVTTSATPGSSISAPSITVSTDMGVDSAGPGAGAAVGVFEIDGGGHVAHANWDAFAGTVTVFVDATSSIFTLSAPIGTFHTIAFSVDSMGNAFWIVDGILSTFTVGGWPAGTLTIRLSATFAAAGSPSPQFNFDNITATTP